MLRKILIFDLDGTLINSKKSIINSFNHAFKKNNIKQINEKYFKKNAGKGSLYFIKNNLNKNNINYLEKINKDFLQIYKKLCIRNISCRIGVRWFLNKYKKKYTYVICTNKNSYYARKILDKLDIKKYFYKVYGSDFLKFKKPSKKLFLKIKNNLNQNKKIIIIGDSEVDYNFAKYSSENFILIKDGYTIKKVKDISQKYSIKNFYELKNILDLFKF